MKTRTCLVILAPMLRVALTAASQINYTVLRLLGPVPDGITVVGRPTLGNDGLLYGVTFQESSANESDGAGTVFRLTRDGRGYSILRRFTVSGGLPRYPNGTLIEAADRRLYGVLYQGGTATAAAFSASTRTARTTSPFAISCSPATTVPGRSASSAKAATARSTA